MVKEASSFLAQCRVAVILGFLIAFLLLGISKGQIARPSSPQRSSPPKGGISGPADPDTSIIAQIRQGDSQAQQGFVCELYDADKQKMQAMAVESLPRIGGWYSIQLYREFLSPAALIRYRKAPTRPATRDVDGKEPVWWSLISLPKVVTNPPPIATPDSTFDAAKIHQYAQIWRDWIQANEATLKALQPTGESVDFSGRRCSQVFRPPRGL